MEIFLTIIGAFLGVLLNYAIPALIDFFKYAKNKRLTGSWVSSWQPRNDKSNEWVAEKVIISPTFGRLKFKNKENQLGYIWHGTAYLRFEKHIVGEWSSLRPGAHSRGTFMLSISPQGDFMFGEIVGPNDAGSIMSSPFVLGRSSEDLEKAKTWLEGNR